MEDAVEASRGWIRRKDTADNCAFEIDDTAAKPANQDVVLRFLFFLVLWLILDGAKFAGLIVGLPAAVVVSWISIRIWPLASTRFSLSSAFALLWFFLRHSFVAGVDVAWRAFHPKLPLCPGLVEVECTLPVGSKRDAHLALGSLLPGSLPVEDRGGQTVVLHCLDKRQPVTLQMKQQEKLLERMVGGESYA